LRICIEYDGEEYHSSDERREADRQRRGWLRDNGWVVVVVRKDDFKGRALDGWLNEIRAAIRERSHR
jgi:very-short-patch-repair endonuclease